MKKVITIIILTVALLLCLASCMHEHSFGEWSVTKNATCTDEGVKTRYCDCGEKQSDVIPTTEHVEQILPSKEATCTDTGLTEGKRCSACEKILVAQYETPITAHTYDDKYDETCNKCGHLRDVECNHAETEAIKGKDSTCTEIGYTDGVKCKKCGEILVAQEVVSLKAHTESDWIIDKKATSTDAGLKHTECTNCEKILNTEVIPMLGVTSYTITYVDAPTHNNPTTYTSDDYIKLQKPIWNGLAFSHWSDEDGNKVTEILRGSEGNIILTANWMHTENMIVSNTSNDILFTLYDEEHNQHYFVYEIGAMHNVVLDELSSYRYSGATNHTWSISETVSFTESSALDVAKTIADSVTYSTSWSDTHTDIEDSSTNKHQSFTIAPDIGVGPVKIKLGEYSNGIDSLSSKGSSDAHYDGGGNDTTHDESKTVSSSISYIKDVSTQVTRTETLDPSISPAGMYRYVQAGSVKVYAIVTYNPETKDYYINIYSYIDQTYETMLYEPIPEYNGDINVVESDPFEFDLNIDELAENIIGKSYYVEFNANGGIGSMPTQMILPNSSAELFRNQFIREGYEFLGWSFVKNDQGVIYMDGQKISHNTNAQERVTLYALWIGVSNGLQYTLNSDGQSYSVTGIGTCKDKDIVIPRVHDDLPVTSIGENAFISRTSLTSVTIPDCVTSIGSDAFAYCTSLTNITIGNSVLDIGSGAFAFCDSLTSITIPNSVTSIGGYAFAYCTSLTNITIGNSVLDIGSSAFAFCDSLTSITIPNSVTSIGGYAFDGCISLTSITIPNSVTSIGYYAFRNCSSLESITLPLVGEIDKINTNFGSIFGISSESSVETKVPSGLKYVVITSGDVIGDFVFRDCTSLESITIPDTVTSIGTCAFDGCTSLIEVNFGENSQLKSIGKDAFNGCSSLTSITIPDSVTSIGGYAFYGCTSLTSVTIGDSVTNIGGRAFQDCTSLASVTFKNIDGWWCATSSTATSGTSISATDLSNPTSAATCLSIHCKYYWNRTE